MEKINVAELLKDCSIGMELNCTMYEDVYFDYVDELNVIHCYIQREGYKTSVTFNQYGTPNSDIKSKCVIFPEGKNTWEGFHRPFKDGDVLNDSSCIFIVKKLGDNNTAALTYCALHNDGYFEDSSILDFCIDSTKLATEEEKAKLFQAIKDNGYQWNAETKTLEKLPKFKIGDEIVKKNSISNSYIVSSVSYDYYGLILPNNTGVGVLNVSEQDEWELISSNKPTFKDGDIVVSSLGHIHILKNRSTSYIYVDFVHNANGSLCKSLTTCVRVVRLATEEEKAKLFQAIKDNGYQWNPESKTLEKIKKEYPKTYEECAKVLLDRASVRNDFGYKGELLVVLQKLLVCRAAYWKIYGEEMGLDGPWEPEWNWREYKFCIGTIHDEIEKFHAGNQNCILSFPTEEMRDAFYENFKKDIEQCKELL